ncbi:haloacid dehalogenase [Methanocella arvoryzae]|uniref:DNA-binding protein (Translin family) n=1 Tax=Methanocella arvoryzae (strain DSM 22066 / NBRC 105507 / MRE50) TaxID=351160 RepID=Q0W0H0_METAR|nr:haloacid dehalogenase [Methanocella arvoryzae]CAJ38123.1 putative DNA-binding protein (translin family) [Methanocella arvoryzae MRE50]
MNHGIEEICDRIRARFDAMDKAREQSLALSRKITRNSGDAIKAIHRGEWDQSAKLIDETRSLVLQVNDILRDFPDIYYSGYVGNAQTEYAEVSILNAVLHGENIPSPDELQVDYAAYLNGVGDTIGELRRHILDQIRTGRPEEGEKYLDLMDELYTELMSFDYPDAITHGLRKKTDVARSLIERTRGEITNALQIKDLKDAMGSFKQKIK